MEEFVSQDASADSSSATDASADSSSQATTQPAPAPAAKGFHEHPDWQRMVRSRHEDRSTIEQLNQRLARFEQAAQRDRAAGQLTAEEKQNYAQMSEQLIRLMSSDPRLARLLEMGNRMPQYDQGMQAFQQSQTQAAQAHNNAARSAIKQLADEAGLKTDTANLKRIVRMVAGEAMDLENGDTRYTQGDLSVLEEAFNNIKPWLDELRKPGEQSLVATKNRTKQLPPAPSRAGAVPGKPAPKPLKETGDVRKFETDMHQRAKDMLLRLSEE